MRRKHQPQNSLDLFLDAICNMFGAFLFLLLFVVVLLQTTRRELAEKRTQSPSYNELKQLTMERDALEAEWREAFEQSRALADLQARIFSPEIAATVQQTLQVVQEQQETEQKNATLQAELDVRNAEIDATSQTVELLESEIETQRSRLQELEREAKERKKMETRQTAPPQLRFSSKIELPIVLKYGRLYFWKRLPNRSPLTFPEFNDDEFYVVKRDSRGALVAPNPACGIDLNADPQEIEVALAERLINVDANRFKLVFVVSPDSFSEFNVARNFVKNAGYDVRILVGTSGERVYDRGGSNNEAQ